MKVSSIIAIALCSLAAHALPTETPVLTTTLEAVQEGALLRPKPDVTPRSEVIENPLEKRANWCTSGSNYNQADADALQRDLQNNSPDSMSFVGAWSSVSWSWGTAKVCIANQYLADNTHIKRWEAGWAMGYIKDMCCSGKSSCSGGNCSGHGDSGLSLEIRVQNSAKSCEF
ncbi:hypothetical protein CMUS01_14868 [Colletotrichum musicola]|uniref:Uncharacterized protein n=1 Tax=Colletotrichum musicola TaxID=2175873 RepID=A0A8H6MQD8_9PEZI|nr:hypothetical protein CMUS01_14868 [Colletotrichum musicola]